MLEKGALGLRYLIKYLENGRKENFLVAMDCLDEIKLASIIIIFVNNSDYFGADIPEFILKGVMTEEDFITHTKEGTKKVDYGFGYRTNSLLSYQEQFNYIRNALAHFRFTFENNIISINMDNYEAKFDIKWLIVLIFTAIANERNKLYKGMGDYSLIAPNIKCDSYEDFLRYIHNGLITFFKVESLTSNKETLKSKLGFKGIPTEEYTFDLLFEFVRKELNRAKVKNGNTEPSINSLEKEFRNIEKVSGNTVKLSLARIDITSPVFQDEQFIDLSFLQKLEYLINKFRLTNPYLYNTIVLQNLLKLIEYLEEGRSLEEEDAKVILLEFKDSEEYLIKAYANLLLGLDLSSKSYLLDKYPIDCHFVHAKNIYKSYIKELNKYYNELKEHGGSNHEKRRILNLLDSYTDKLNSAINEETKKDIFWNIRNAITHNQIEFREDFVRLYITGQNLNLRKFSKKSKTWIEKEFVNNNPIWEMIMSKKDFLALFDDLYESLGIEVQVNISKYCKRSSYLN